MNLGEKEGIAICLKRMGTKFLTNGHCTKDEVKSLIDEIEKNEPGMVIKGKDEILRLLAETFLHCAMGNCAAYAML